jgi:histidinol-phosphate/aromatic aminotransferase/cobyric acid decarboxylase-like protein
MDYAHCEILLKRLSAIPARHSLHSVRFAAEARRTPQRIRFDFNETRTHSDDQVQREIERLVAQKSHANLITAAQELIADRHAIHPDSIALFRGANEAIKVSILALTGVNWRVLLPDIAYIGHVKAAIAARTQIHYLKVSHQIRTNLSMEYLGSERLTRAVEKVRPHLVLLGNPSNPLGDFLCAMQFQELFEATRTLRPPPIFVIDAAFERFAHAQGKQVPDYTKYIESGRILVIESLSKADGYAGSRAGYVYGSPNLVRKIAARRCSSKPISLLGAATIVTSRRPDNDIFVTETVVSLLNEVKWFVENAREQLADPVGSVPIIRTSSSGFVLLKIPEIFCDEIVHRLKSETNMDVALVPRFFETTKDVLQGRVADIHGMPVPGLVRLSLGVHDENVRLLKEVSQAIRSATLARS